MAQYYLVDPFEVKKFTVISGDISDDVIRLSIIDAQNLRLAYVLGRKLMDKLAESDLEPKYQTLLDKYVKPYLRQAASVEVLDAVLIDISKAGAKERTSEQGNNLDSGALNTLIVKRQQKADSYKRLLTEWLADNTGSFPELYAPQNGKQERKDFGKIFGAFDNW